jgi:hypothetical protein
MTLPLPASRIIGAPKAQIVAGAHGGTAGSISNAEYALTAAPQ